MGQNLPSASRLTSADQEFYNWMIKLLDEAGKVRSLVHKKLQGTHGRNNLTASPSAHAMDITAFVMSKSAIIAPTVVSKPPAVPACAFGKVKWAKYFGDIGVGRHYLLT